MMRNRYFVGNVREGDTRTDKNCPHLILQTHDELLFETPKELLAEFAPAAAECMEKALDLSVELTVEIKVGSNWGNMSPWNLQADT